MLTNDQQQACERLVSLARVRTNTTETALPISVLARWTVPLIVGPSGTGKMYVCQEVGRCLGDWPCRRWDVGSWSTSSSSSSHSSLDQIRAFIGQQAAGCVVYLTGIDAVRTGSDRNESYQQAVVGEIEQFLDEASARPARLTKKDGSALPARVLVIVGGCFASLWGDTAIGGPGAGDAWKLADGDLPGDPDAVAGWLREHSRLPASILRRLSPEPLVLRPMTSAQAEALAARLYANLPPVFDGLSQQELGVALQGVHGWRGVSALIERTWIDGYEPLAGAEASVAVQTHDAPPSVLVLNGDPPQNLSPDMAASSSVLAPAPVPKIIELHPIQEAGLVSDASSAQATAADWTVDGVCLYRFGWRLGQHLGLPHTGGRLLTKARRLGLHNAWLLEDLALARGYLLPGETKTQAEVPERVTRAEFTDAELAAALLSPCLELPKRVICRGAYVLASLLASVAPIEIVRAARGARGQLIVRHVALLAHALYPQSRRWRDLVFALPSTYDQLVLKSEQLPDAAIRRALADYAD